MAISDSAILVVKGIKHYLPKILAAYKSNSMPTITVNIDDINTGDNKEPNAADHKVTFHNVSLVEQFDIRDILFYKQDGKYTILLGQSVVDKARADKLETVTGKLISTPALKTFRTVNTAPFNPGGFQEAKNYDSTFANTPRVVGTKARLLTR